MRKKELALAVIERLKKEYPDSDCTLDYNEAWKLLISVRLAAQCTDARVNMIVPKLYEKFPDVNALADAPETILTDRSGQTPCAGFSFSISTPERFPAQRRLQTSVAITKARFRSAGDVCRRILQRLCSILSNRNTKRVRLSP